MSIFNLWKSTGKAGDLVRALQSQGYTQRSWSTNMETVPLAGTYRYYLGVCDDPGLVVRRFNAVSDATVAASGTNYFTFKPFLNDGGTVKYLGTAQSTATLAITTDRTFRLHSEENLEEPVPQGASLGVEVVVTGTPSGGRLLLQASVYYGG